MTKGEPINVTIGRLRGAIKSRDKERSLEILDLLSRKINDLEEVKKEIENTL
jgi:hypothetical protein